MSMGWECPRCGSTWSPSVMKCCGPRIRIDYVTTDDASLPHTCWMNAEGNCGYCGRSMRTETEITS